MSKDDKLTDIVRNMVTGGRDYNELNEIGKKEVDSWKGEILALITEAEDETFDVAWDMGYAEGSAQAELKEGKK